MYRRGLSILEEVGTEYTKKRMFVEEEEPASYNNKRVAVGVTKRTGRPFYIDCKEGWRILIIGMTGSGKTFTIRSMCDRFYRSGYNLFYITDVKDEFKSSIQPVQKKFESFLAPGEEGEGIPIRALRPTFFKDSKNQRKLKEGNEWFSVRPKDMTIADFSTLLNIDAKRDTIQDAFSVMRPHLEEAIEERGTITWGVIESCFETIQEEGVHPSTVEALKRVFLPIRSSKFFVEKYQKSIIDMLKNGEVPAINMENFEDFGKGALSFPPVVVGIVLRQVINAVRQKIIGRIVTVVDEAQSFIPQDESFSCVADFEASARLDRRYEANYMYAVQTLIDEKKDEIVLPSVIYSNCRYMIVPYNCQKRDLTRILLDLSVVSQGRASYVASELIRGMDKHDWIIFDRTEKVYEVVRFYAPLSRHAEAGA